MTTQTAPDTDSVDLAEFRSTVRAFANAEIHPGAAARDESKEFPAQLVKRLGQQDLMGISVPEEFGGLGLSTSRGQVISLHEHDGARVVLEGVLVDHAEGGEHPDLGQAVVVHGRQSGIAVAVLRADGIARRLAWL